MPHFNLVFPGDLEFGQKRILNRIYVPETGEIIYNLCFLRNITGELYFYFHNLCPARKYLNTKNVSVSFILIIISLAL